MRDRNNNSRTYSAICDECGKPCELPFKPSSDKPVYCSDCFKKKQRENSSDSDRSSFRGNSQSNFRNDNRSNFRNDSRSNFRNDNRSNFKDRDRRMYPAVCDSCGKRCEVPFRPTSGKPIYCEDCFKKNGDNKRSVNRDSYISKDNGGDQLKEQVVALGIKLDKIIKILEMNNDSKTSKEEKIGKTKKKTTLKKEKRIIKKNKTKRSPKKKRAEKKTAKKKKK